MKKYQLENKYLIVELLDIGASIYAIRLNEKDNRNIVLNTNALENYLGPENGYFGATVGPVTGRIPNGTLMIDGKTHSLTINEKGSNTLHGGNASFAFKTFHVTRQSENEIVYSLLTKDNEGGFPGHLKVEVIYRLEGNSLTVSYAVTPSKKTILNVTNHSYFNLNGEGTILDHHLTLPATHYYTLDSLQINRQQQRIKPHSLFDFTVPKRLKEVILNPKISKMPTMGLDHLFVVPSRTLILTGRDVTLSVTSDAPAFQLYSTNFPPAFKNENGKEILLYQGLAIEPVSVVSGISGKYPDLEVNPGKTYTRVINYKIEINQ